MDTSVQVRHTQQIPSIEDVKVDGEIFTHTKENDNKTTILFDPVIRTGIVRFEVLGINKLTKVGIADESVHYDRDEDSDARGWEKTVEYHRNLGLRHIGTFIPTKEYHDGDRVAME
ncbi:MAG: hypothetical protein EZS28_029441, partial [Streblomastix strix]